MARRRGGTGKHSLHHELLAALREPGCPACRLAAAAVMRYLDDLIYEHVNEIELRETLRAAGGFCNTHSWQLERMRAAFGTSIIYRDVLHNLGRRLRARQPGAPLSLYGSGRAEGSLLGRLAALTTGPRAAGTTDPHTACPACQVRRDREVLVLRTLLVSLGDAEFAAAYTVATGLCLVHLEQASDVAAAEGGLESGLETAIARALDSIEVTVGELDEFVRKHDYRFHQETIGAEGSAWLRAIEMIAAQEGLR